MNISTRRAGYKRLDKRRASHMVKREITFEMVKKTTNIKQEGWWVVNKELLRGFKSWVWGENVHPQVYLSILQELILCSARLDYDSLADLGKNKYTAVCPCDTCQYYFPFPISSILPIFPWLCVLNQLSYLVALLLLHLQNGRTIRCLPHPLGCITCSGNSKTWVELFQL